MGPAPDVKDALKSRYVEIEGWIEERMGDMEGEFQGGAIDVMTTQTRWKAGGNGWRRVTT